MRKVRTSLFIFAAGMVAVMNAQSASVRTETFIVHGNCGMCKKTIEKAASVKGVKTASWNDETKILELKFDNGKTSPETVLRNVAYAGYDNEKYLAPRSAYEKLHGCCQYERKDIAGAVSTTSATSEHGQHSPASREPGATGKQTNDSGIDQVYDNYFGIKNALVKTDAKEAAGAARRFLESVEAVKMSAMKKNEHDVYMKQLGAIRSTAESIAQEKNIEKQRAAFSKMTSPLMELMKTIKPTYEVYLDHCPMYNDGKGANWISKEKEIRNPFYGSKMLTCGNVAEIIK